MGLKQPLQELQSICAHQSCMSYHYSNQHFYLRPHTFHKAAAVGYEAIKRVRNFNDMNFDIKGCPYIVFYLLQNMDTVMHHGSDIITRQGPSVTVDNEQVTVSLRSLLRTSTNARCWIGNTVHSSDYYPAQDVWCPPPHCSTAVMSVVETVNEQLQHFLTAAPSFPK